MRRIARTDIVARCFVGATAIGHAVEDACFYV
jgi:hypothetical protein